VLCPDLTLVKKADAASVVAGSSIGFTLWLNNTGSGSAFDVTLTDALPGGSGVDWSISPATTGCAITGAPPAETLDCDLGELASGAGVSVHVTSGTTTASCQEYPNSATASASNHANVTASASTSVTCPPTQITRTQGFWATHTAYTERVFDQTLGGTLDVGSGSHVRTIDTYGKLFGAWYSSIPYKTDGHKRTQVDSARMALLQQLVTAELNCAAFGCNATTQGLIASANLAYAGNSKGAMATSTAALDAYNNGGDSLALPTTYGDWNPATPDVSASIANKAFWNNP
jgi:uncharacterized repeat protein (TIGR01451 family)